MDITTSFQESDSISVTPTTNISNAIGSETSRYSISTGGMTRHTASSMAAESTLILSTTEAYGDIGEMKSEMDINPTETTNSSDVTVFVAANSSDVITMVTGNASDIMMDYFDEDEDDEYTWPLRKQVIVGIILFLLSVVIILGNILTILVFLRDPKIRTVQNMYIFNLAITDICIGVSSVPFYAIYTVLGYEWVLGYEYCKLWSIVDYWVCAESSLTIILISHDRLLMVTKGVTYIHAETKTKALIKILFTWLISFLIYGPAVIGYNYWRGYSIIDEMDCDVEFATEFWYTTITAFLEFCVPFVLLVTFSSLLYTNLRERSKKINKSVSKHTVAVVSLDSDSNAKPTTTAKHESTALSKDKKAARSLAILVITYAICWTPYTIMTVINAFCEICVHEDAYEVATWLLWANSAFNPFLYAATNQRFRHNFEVLICKLVNKDRIHPMKSSSQANKTEQVSTSKA